MNLATASLFLLIATPNYVERMSEDRVCECKFAFFQKHTGRVVPEHQRANICAMYPGPKFREGKKYRNELQQYNECLAGK
jgi:hypothetical protein